MADELRSEILEQLGIRWLVAHHAEVVGRIHNAGAEVPLPDAVHDDARGQRMIGDVVGELEPSAAVGVGLFVRRAEHGEKTALHHRAHGVRIAADVQLTSSIFGLSSMPFT